VTLHSFQLDTLLENTVQGHDINVLFVLAFTRSQNWVHLLAILKAEKAIATKTATHIAAKELKRRTQVA